MRLVSGVAAGQNALIAAQTLNPPEERGCSKTVRRQERDALRSCGGLDTILAEIPPGRK